MTEIPGTPLRIVQLWASAKVLIKGMHSFGPQNIASRSLFRLKPFQCRLQRHLTLKKNRLTPSVRHHKTTILITGPQCKNGREVHLCTYGIGINVFHNPNMLRFRADTANREFLMQTPNMLTLHSFSYANCSAPGSERLYAVQQQPTLWTLSFRIQSARPQTNQ